MTSSSSRFSTPEKQQRGHGVRRRWSFIKNERLLLCTWSSLLYIHTLEDAVFLQPTFSRSGVRAQAAVALFDQTEAWTRVSSAVCESWIVPLCAWERGTHTGYGSKPRMASGHYSPSLPDSRRLFLRGEPGTYWHQHGRSPTMNNSTHNPHAHHQLERLLLPMPQSTTLRLLLGLCLVTSLSMSSAILIVALAFALSGAPRGGVSPL
jgi:hypothetical protein